MFHRDTRQPFHPTIVLRERGDVVLTYETDLVSLNTELAEASVGSLRGFIIIMEVEEENEGKSPIVVSGVANGPGQTWRDGCRLPFVEGVEPTFIHLSGAGPAYRIIGGRLRKVAILKAAGKLRRAF